MVVRLQQVVGDESLPAAPFGAADLPALGLPRSQLEHAVRRGDVRVVHRGVYLRSDLPLDLLTRCRALALVLPPGAVIARSTAAWLWGFDPRGPSERHDPIPVQCLVRAGSTPPRRPGVTSFAATLTDDEVDELHGVPVTSALRTAMDVARYRPHWVAFGLLDRMLRVAFLDRRQAIESIERWRGERFVDQARFLLRHAAGCAESDGESWARLRILEAGLPVPQLQLEVRTPSGQFLARLDLADVENQVGNEYDGVDHHSSEEDRAFDAARRRVVERETNWRVHAFGMEAVFGHAMALEDLVARTTGASPTITRRRRWA